MSVNPEFVRFTVNQPAGYDRECANGFKMKTSNTKAQPSESVSQVDDRLGSSLFDRMEKILTGEVE